MIEEEPGSAHNLDEELCELRWDELPGIKNRIPWIKLGSSPEPRPTIPDPQTSCNISWIAGHLLKTSEEGVSWVGMS